MNILTGKEFSFSLCAALGLDPKLTRRIVLDVAADSLVIAYVELIGDKRLLNISQTLNGVDFKIVNVEEMKK